jgi:hypothetical protein
MKLMKNAENRAKGKMPAALAAALFLAAAGPAPAFAQDRPVALAVPTYADLADLAGTANLVVKAKIRQQSALDPARSPLLRPGWVRLYLEADTEALLAGHSAIGESLRYLADVPLDAKGKAPSLKKQEVLLFALPVPGKPDQLQLVTNQAQVAATPEVEAQVRAIIAGLVAPDTPPRITGVRDAFSVAGNLAGESETQIFLQTDTDQPVSLSVVRRPGMAPQWGVSWTDVVDEAARPPERDTLAWYRLACFLPPQLPARANHSDGGAARTRAAQDYALVIDQLGVCPRALQPAKL